MSTKLIFATVFTSGIIALSLFAGIAGAAPFEQWNRTFRGAGNSSAYSVQQIADGEYLISGSTCSSYDPWQCSPSLLKTDADGNEQWNKTFSSDYGARSILQTADGGYIFADRSLVKVDVNGSEQWNMTFGGEQDDEVFSVQQTGDGDYIVAGTTSFDAGKSYAWLRKVGKEQTGTATPTASPTETPIATPTQTLRAVSNETQTVSPAEKIAGFEIILPIAIHLAVNKIGRKRR